MEYLNQLAQINWWQVFLAIVLLLVCVKFLWSLADWFIVEKLGIKTRKMRQREEEQKLLKATAELAKTTAENLDKLQKRHSKDEEEFRNNLNNYMEESRKDRKALHDEMTKFSNNRVADRQQSLQIQKELISSQKDSDAKIENLTDMFLQKEISDYRWEIINLADKISDGRSVSKECFRHVIATYSKYEEIIEKHGLTNGEVDISMEIIHEAYRKLLKEGL